MNPNRVKRSLNSGMVQVGTWVTTIRSPQLPQMLASAGFDFVYIDMEHSSFSIETVGDLCCAALGAGLVPIVRPPAKEPHLLTRPLEAGAMGLLVPHVDTRNQAEAAVRAIRFPPLGDRGFNTQTVHSGFAGARAEEYARWAHEETLLIVQIESDQAVGNLDEILSVDGVDGAVVGRGDLSADLGVTGQTGHPEVTRRVERLIDACNAHGKIPGLLVQDVESARHWIARGIRLVPYANETTILINAASRAIGEIRESGRSVP